MRRNIVLFGLLAIALISYFGRRRQGLEKGIPHPAAATKSQAAASSAPAAGAVPVAPSKGEGPVKLALFEDKISMKRAAYIHVGSGATAIELRLEPQPACQTGDLDIIKLRSGGQALVVSLEPLGGSGEVAKQVVTATHLYSGLTLRLTAGSDKPKLFGIFICSDRQRDGRCRGKRLADMRATPVKEAGTGDDEVYYFQPLVLESQRYLHFLGTAEQYGSFAAYVAARQGSSAQAIEEGQKLESKLGSVPITSSERPDHAGTTLHLPLPFLSVKACDGEVRRSAAPRA